jgi:hypothetical protein
MVLKWCLTGRVAMNFLPGTGIIIPTTGTSFLAGNKYPDFLKEIKTDDDNIALLAKTFLKNKVVEKLPLPIKERTL